MNAIPSSIPIQGPSQAAARIKEFIEQFRVQTRVPGVSVAVLVRGEYIQVNSGIANTETKVALTDSSRFKLSCMQKLLVSMVAARLAVDGKLNLDAPIAQYLPELAGKNGDKILLKHLLSHTSGYQGENMADPDVVSEYTWDEFVASFNRRPQLFEPGTVFDYSHSAFVLVARAIENAAGKSVRELISQYLTEPLKIAAIAAGHENPEELVADHVTNPLTRLLIPATPIEWSEFWSPSLVAPRLTLRDLVQICRAAFSVASVLPKEARELLIAPAIKLVAHVGARSEEIPVGFGLGCASYASGLYGLGASSQGQCTAIRFDAQGQFVIAIGLASAQPFLRDTVINKLMAALSITAQVRSKAVEGITPPNFSLQELAGTYESAQYATVEAAIEDGKLMLRRGHNPAISHGNRRQPLVLVRSPLGRISLVDDPIGISVGFCNDPASAAPILMLGSKSYRKVK